MNISEILSGLKLRFLIWLCPGLLAEVDRLRWMMDANFDMHVLPIPYSPGTFQMAVDNCKNTEPGMFAGRTTWQDRQTSLIEIYRRSQ
jgi:hypothetical protein